jgi:hypothetical protein
LSGKPRNDELALTIMQIIKERKPQTVKELVDLTKERIQIPDQEIIEFLLKLQNEGKLNLATQSPQVTPSLIAYLKMEQAYWFWATVAIAVATAAVIFAVPESFYPLVYIRYVLGAVYVLWLPGYTFMRALFPEKPSTKNSERKLDTVERIGLSLGMSLALVPIVGLLLNYTPWGIRLTPIVLSLLLLTIIFATTAVIRENQAHK